MRIAVADIPTQAYQNLIVQPVWDSQPIGTTPANQLPFFTNVAQTATGVTKTLVDTNMPLQGFFPNPDNYFLTGLQFHPLNRAPLNAVYALTDISDLCRVLDQGIFSLVIGSANTKLVEGHCQLFPSGLGLQGMVTTGGATSSNVSYVVGNGIRDIQNAFGFTGNFAEKINSGEKLNGLITWPAGVPTLSNTFTGRVYTRGIWGQGIR